MLTNRCSFVYSRTKPNQEFIIINLHQILMAQEERGTATFSLPVVLLADRDKEEMDQDLSNELGQDLIGTKIITRSGSPMKMGDMERVAVGQAKTILVLTPEANDVRY